MSFENANVKKLSSMQQSNSRNNAISHDEKRKLFLNALNAPGLAESIASVFPLHLRRTEDNGVGKAKMWIETLINMSAVKSEIAVCTGESAVGALRVAAQMGLEPGPLGLVYFHARWNGDINYYELSMTIGYRGYLELMRRTGEVSDIDAVIVYEKDEFSLQKKSVVANGKLMYIWELNHKPFRGGDRGVKTDVYANVNMKNADAHLEIMNDKDIERIKRTSRSRTKQGQLVGPWVDHEDEMWRKSIVRRLQKWVGLSTEFSIAETLDNLYDVDVSQNLSKMAKGDVSQQLMNLRDSTSSIISDKYAEELPEVIIED